MSRPKRTGLYRSSFVGGKRLKNRPSALREEPSCRRLTRFSGFLTPTTGLRLRGRPADKAQSGGRTVQAKNKKESVAASASFGDLRRAEIGYTRSSARCSTSYEGVACASSRDRASNGAATRAAVGARGRGRPHRPRLRSQREWTRSGRGLMRGRGWLRRRARTRFRWVISANGEFRSHHGKPSPA
jgi:hypothetical protein